MSEIKKYNFDTGKYRKYATTNANGINTYVQKLLKEGEETISVETGLSRLSESIELLKDNVAWLAKNGGGGSGSGGGGTTVTEADGTLKVNNIETGGQVVMTSDGLRISLEGTSVALNKGWTVTVNIGSSQIASGTLSFSSNIMYVQASRVSAALTNHVGTLNIVASYADDTNAIYGNVGWSGSVVESTVSITAGSSSSTVQQLADTNIVFGYSVGYTGSVRPNYQFKVEVYKSSTLINTYTEDLSITETTQQSKTVKVLGNIIPQSEASSVGVYRLVSSLTSIENAQLTASVTSTFTVASSEILIAVTAPGQSEDNPTEISVGGSMQVRFTAYLQNVSTYTYSIKVGDTVIVSNALGRFNEEITQSISVANKSWATAGSSAVVTIIVTSGDKSASEVCYIKFVTAENSLLTMRDVATAGQILGFSANEYNTGESEFTYSNSSYTNGGITYALSCGITPINRNTKSIITSGSDAPYLRISNGATFRIGNWKLTDSTSTVKRALSDFFQDSENAVNEFTLSICFKADYHADDDRTVLFCGSLDTSTRKVSTGLSIDVHDIYINNESVYELSDNVINIVDITCSKGISRGYDSSGNLTDFISYTIRVYVNGVCTAVRTLSSTFMNLGSYIYLGSRYYQLNGVDTYINRCDCNIYSVAFYDKCLSDYDIMVNRANLLALTSYVDGSPDYTKIEAELKRNFCERAAGGSITSYLYDLDTNTYTIDFLLNDSRTGLDEGKLSDYAKAIGIPVMFIDVSSDSAWSFANFTTQQTAGSVSLGSTSNKVLEYWDPSGNNSSVVSLDNVTIELQGTSTLADYVKNINITVPDDTVFMPKSTWFPENTYTLKADVVDSSHSCNASIGKFINEQFGYKSDGSAWMPFSPVAVDNVYNSDYKANQQKDVTLKHTVEGFPVLLIMKFYTGTEGGVSVTPLGIYSFNLGRDALRNLGFKKVNSITVDNAQPEFTVFPYAAQNVVIDETDSDACWIEIKDTTSISDMLNLTDTMPDEFDTSKGDFWQNNANILDNRYEVRYPSGKKTSDYPLFSTFVSNIMALPFEGCATTDIYGNVTIPQISGSYDEYKCSTDGTGYETTGNKVNISTDPNAYVSGDHNLGFNSDSYLKYFVIGNLFGLEDNFGKNMASVAWNGVDSLGVDNSTFYAQFYDLDSALGGGNQGLLDIMYDMALKFLYNRQDGDKDYGYVAETFNSAKALSQTVYSANHNKLWLSLDTIVGRQVLGESADKSLYTDRWYALRRELDSIITSFNSANGTSYKTFWDFFTDEYFVKQTGDCGPLLFNYDYKLKYFLQFTNEQTIQETKALTKLHGRRIEYTRSWLKHRITFLDTYFHWRDSSQTLGFKNDFESSGANTVYTTPEAFPVKTNTSIILYNSVGNQTETFYFVPENTETLVNAADSASESVLNWNMSNSPQLIQLGNDDIKLADMHVATLSYQANVNNIDYTGYPSLTELDFSQNNKFNGFTLNAFKPVKNEGEIYDRNPVSELRILDFSNTSGTSFTLSLVDVTSSGTDTKFQKLYKIDISGSSCISDLTLPDVPLLELDVEGSTITDFDLRNQAYLPFVSLAGCSRLQTVTIYNCDSYEKFEISDLNNLTSCEVSQCDEIENVTISSCTALSKINIEACAKLKSITIRNCPAITDGIVIRECPSLESVTVSNCTGVTVLNISQSNQAGITKLDLSTTKITHLSGDDADETLLDLSKFTSLSDFNISGNSSVTEIQFQYTVSSSPVTLTRAFTQCTGLKRIYGYVSLSASRLFRGCTSFSVHGTDLSSVTYNGKSILSSGVVQLPSDFYSPAQQTVTGTKVTNVVINTKNLDYEFELTACTAFDIYYILSRCGKVTSMNCTFRFLQTNPFSWTSSADNSPNRHMFENATSLVSIDQCFYQNKSTLIRLFSPDVTVDDSDTVSGTDNGLFSPLVNTLTSCTNLFYGYRIIFDRRLFRHTSSDYRISRFYYFANFNLVENAETLSYSDISSTSGLLSLLSTSGKVGNMSGFFTDLPDVASLWAFGDTGMSYLDYDTVSGIPASVVRRSICSTYGTGTINSVASLFKTPSKVTTIKDAFRVTSSYTLGDTVYRVNMPVTDNEFEGMTALKYVGYRNADGENTDEHHSSFVGNGIYRYIAQTAFPYNILSPCSNIEMFAGFFDGCQQGSLEAESVELPGTMFAGKTKLVNTAMLFRNVKFAYTLSSDSFADCTGLTNVQYMFSIETSDSTNGISSTAADMAHRGTGSIPQHLFRHGGKNVTVSYEGLSGITDFASEDFTSSVTSGTATTTLTGKRYTWNKGTDSYKCEIIGGTVTWYKNDEESTKAGCLSSVSFTYWNPNTKITDMRYCFRGCNFDAYSLPSRTATADRIEVNSGYEPYDYVWKNNAFTQMTVNTNYMTEQWTYDGIVSQIGTYNGYSVQNLDDEHDRITPTIYNIVTGSTVSGTLEYCCSPDLLRYCAVNCQIAGLFAYSGHDEVDSSHGNTFSSATGNTSYGLKGRIVPYLLVPFSTATDVNINYMFADCKMISAYRYNSKTYPIPAGFFKNCKNVAYMSHTFAEMCILQTADLNVFKQITPAKLKDISYIFYRVYVYGTSSSSPLALSGLFNTFNSISSMKYAFARTYNVSNESPKQTAVYISFSNIFPSSAYKGSNFSSNMEFSYVFAYFSSGYVTFPSSGSRTLEDNSTTNNYLYYGE